MEKYRERSVKAPPPRKCEHKVFRKAVNCYRKKLCQRIELPETIKAIMRAPGDEESWPRLEQLREGVARCLLGERAINLDEEVAADIADAMERSRPGRCVKKFIDEIGPGCNHAPEGSRILVSARGQAKKTFSENRAALAAAVRKLAGTKVFVHTRPIGTIRTPPIDDFAAKLLHNRKDYTLNKIATELRITKAKVLDKILLCLWDALFLDQCEA